MAEMETVTVLYNEEQVKNLDLQELVRETTWKELLTQLVDSNRLNPWDIDISKLVDSYVSAVKRMKVLDLHVPANIILAASVLLRMKSETLTIFEIEEELQAAEPVEGQQRIYPEVPVLVPRIRLQPRRKITLVELMQALEEALRMKERRDIESNAPMPTMNFMVNLEDIDEKANSIYDFIKENVDSDKATTFTILADRFKNSDSILLDLFIPLLFLAHKTRVYVYQERFFDEIIVRLAG
jgi:segregation and condensation protein A